MGLLLHRIMATAVTSNVATARLMLSDPRKGAEYGRAIYRLYREHLEMPVDRIQSCSLDAIIPSVASESIVVKYPLYHQGNVSGDETMHLCLIAKALGVQRAFEIGTFDGRTAANLAANCSPSAEVYSLDLPDVVAPELGIDPREMRWVGARVVTLPDNVTLLKGDSATFDFSPYRGSVDMFFVDGSHTYEYVCRDTATAGDCIRPGGVIVWHDYGQWPGVTRYINEIAGERDLHWIEGTSLVVDLVS